MVKIYVALRDFWHKNVLVTKGSQVGLKASEAKYLGHVVELQRPVPAVEVAVETVSEKVEVEAPAPSKRKRGEDA